MRDATAHGLMFALGAAAALGAIWIILSRRSSTAAAGDASSSYSYSWLSSSGSAENIFGKPYAATSGKRDEDVNL